VVLCAALPWAWFLVRDLGWLAEPFAVAMPSICAVLIVLLGVAAFGTRRLGPVAVAVSLAVFGLVVVEGPRAPERTGAPRPPLRVVSANVFGGNRTPGAAAAALARTGADVLVAVEVPGGFGRLLADRDTTRPFEALGRNTVVRSRYPIQPQPLPPSIPVGRALRAVIRTPSGPVVLYAVHALNPAYEYSFASQLDFVNRVRRAALAETMPVVIAGDFNLSDRELGYRELAGSFRDAARAGWADDTFDRGLWRVLFLRIDYVFIDRSWCAADAGRLEVPGSDHDAVAVTVGPCPGARSA